MRRTAAISRWWSRVRRRCRASRWPHTRAHVHVHLSTSTPILIRDETSTPEPAPRRCRLLRLPAPLVSLSTCLPVSQADSAVSAHSPPLPSSCKPRSVRRRPTPRWMHTEWRSKKSERRRRRRHRLRNPCPVASPSSPIGERWSPTMARRITSTTTRATGAWSDMGRGLGESMSQWGAPPTHPT